MKNSNKTIEDLMLKFKPIIGENYDTYKNHVYRVYFNSCIIDSNKENELKYAIASVFHDIGIWTDNTFDYLDPSIKQVTKYLTEIGKQHWVDEISLIINWHHKLTPYHGKYEGTINSFRKADWIDVSMGLINFNIDKFKIKEIKFAWPNLGFHMFLIKKSINYSFRNPFNPLPMFKK